MKLDERILPGKRPLTCFDTEQAKEFIGKKCYFSDDARDFMNLDKADGDTLFYVAELQNIWTAEEYCFADNSNDYRFILPFEWVKPEEPEKKWRPYLINEWLQEHNFGDMIELRHKGSKREFTVMFTGYVQGGNDAIWVVLGNWAENFDNLFEYYELIDKTNDGKFAWRPFGIEVK